MDVRGFWYDQAVKVESSVLRLSGTLVLMVRTVSRRQSGRQFLQFVKLCKGRDLGKINPEVLNRAKKVVQSDSPHRLWTFFGEELNQLEERCLLRLKGHITRRR